MNHWGTDWQRLFGGARMSLINAKVNLITFLLENQV